VNRPAELVYIVDDDESLRLGVGELVASVGMTVLTFHDADSFLRAPRGETPACLVLDVRMPGLSGLDLQRRLVALDAALPIVFLSGKGDIPMSVEAMKGGAVTFLTKPFRPEELLAAIRDGIERDRAARAERLALSELRHRHDRLTPREREVMAGVVAGTLNKQIAAALGTREATVKEQRAHVMTKMGAGSVPELVRMASRLAMGAAPPGTDQGRISIRPRSGRPR
jgi:FixJ family two-component response regulator